MTPKEKAGWLVERFYFSLPNNGSFTGLNNINRRWEEAKMCALIAVDEIMKAIPDASDDDSPYNHELVYWKEVKQEIEKR